MTLPKGARELLDLIHDDGIPREVYAERLRAIVANEEFDPDARIAAGDMLLRVSQDINTIAVLEGVVEFKKEDGGAAWIGEVSRPDDPSEKHEGFDAWSARLRGGEFRPSDSEGLFVRIHSYEHPVSYSIVNDDDERMHIDAKKIAGKRVRITIEVIPDYGAST